MFFSSEQDFYTIQLAICPTFACGGIQVKLVVVGHIHLDLFSNVEDIL